MLGGKIGDDVHLVLVLKVVVGFFCLYTHSLKMFPAKKWEHEEINHPVLVCAKLGFRHIDLQNLLFGVLYGLFLRNLLVALVLFLQFSIGETTVSLASPATACTSAFST